MGPDAINAAVWAVAHGVYIEARGAEGAYTESNRNNLVNAALNYEHPIDAIMWWDSDMQAPAQAILRLWNHDKEIVGATYREREPPNRHLGKFANDGDAKTRVGLRRMVLMPGGMIMVRTAVYRRLPAPWYRLDDDGLRDDYHFCNQAAGVGIRVWCDMELTAKIAHRGEQSVGWFADGEAVVGRPDPRENVENLSEARRALAS